MSSIVLGMGNDAVMFGDRDASNVPDDDLIQLVNPAAVNISAFDLSVLRGDGRGHHRVQGLPDFVGKPPAPIVGFRLADGFAYSQYCSHYARY